MAKKNLMDAEPAAEGAELFIFTLDVPLLHPASTSYPYEGSELQGEKAKIYALGFQETLKEWTEEKKISGVFNMQSGWIGGYVKKPCVMVECTAEAADKISTDFANKIAERAGFMRNNKGA